MKIRAGSKKFGGRWARGPRKPWSLVHFRTPAYKFQCSPELQGWGMRLTTCSGGRGKVRPGVVQRERALALRQRRAPAQRVVLSSGLQAEPWHLCPFHPLPSLIIALSSLPTSPKSTLPRPWSVCNPCVTIFYILPSQSSLQGASAWPPF